MRIVLILAFTSAMAFAQPRPFQTARLQSTAGAGVASLLVNEAALLNPATLSFFTDTFASYQRTTTEVEKKNPERLADGRRAAASQHSEGYFLFDNTGVLKGGFSFQRQSEDAFSRERMTVTLAGPVTPEVSLGVIYRHTTDSRPPRYSRHRHHISHPLVLGMSWVQSENFILGLVWEDPSRATPGESRAIAGLQYGLTDALLLIGDAGGDPTADFQDRHLWRGALQMNVFSDFFARAGYYEDKTVNLRGFAWGLSWTGPKLGIDFAMKDSRQIDDEKDYLYPKERVRDLSFAVSLQF